MPRTFCILLAAGLLLLNFTASSQTKQIRLRTGTITSTTQFGFAEDRPTTWSSYDDVWVHGFWNNEWADELRKVASVDKAAKTLTLSSAPVYPLATAKH